MEMGQGTAVGESSMMQGTAAAEAWVVRLNRALRHSSLRELGPEVTQVLLRKALTYALTETPWASHNTRDCDAWIREGFLDPRCAVTLNSPHTMARLVGYLVQQLEMLLGAEATASMGEALAPLLQEVPLHYPDSSTRRTALDEPRACRQEKPPAQPSRRPAPAILLVEDNEAEIKITQRALRECAFATDLLVVRDGQEALDYLLGQGVYAPAAGDQTAWRRPDLILLDLNLPRLNGLEVLKRIRTHPTLNLIPVVVLTTSRRQEDIQAVYRAGANTYIEKPRDFAHFVHVLQSIHRYWLDTAVLPFSP